MFCKWQRNHSWSICFPPSSCLCVPSHENNQRWQLAEVTT